MSRNLIPKTLTATGGSSPNAAQKQRAPARPKVQSDLNKQSPTKMSLSKEETKGIKEDNRTSQSTPNAQNVIPAPSTTPTTTTPNQKSSKTSLLKPNDQGVVSSKKGRQKRAKRTPKEQVESIARRLRTNARDPEAAKLTVDEAMMVAWRVREQLMLDDALLELNPPILIVGDIHGQFLDLCSIFDQNGDPPKTAYLFLGDYVDRGPNSTEVATLLFCYKLLYPKSIYLLRGNHECATINRCYGFWDEMIERFNATTWEVFQKTFNCLPLCARIGKRIFCMHGGISRELTAWHQLSYIRRPIDIPDYGIICDLLWSDPDADITGYADSPRGVSYAFGEDALKEFCRQMFIDLVVRAHQVVQDGYEFFANRHLVTIFSAPYYCQEFDNAASVMIVDPSLQCRFKLRHPVEIEQKLMEKALQAKKDDGLDETFPPGEMEVPQPSQLPPPPEFAGSCCEGRTYRYDGPANLTVDEQREQGQRSAKE
ncbi:Serine/threonine-protein phosphatase [Aphelenchoides besseyi]|nr:Serine/threonine-protein phosphatase [Aphelenchoides besseyi]